MAKPQKPQDATCHSRCSTTNVPPHWEPIRQNFAAPRWQWHLYKSGVGDLLPRTNLWHLRPPFKTETEEYDWCYLLNWRTNLKMAFIRRQCITEYLWPYDRQIALMDIPLDALIFIWTIYSMFLAYMSKEAICSTSCLYLYKIAHCISLRLDPRFWMVIDVKDLWEVMNH
jgi:hypothetical protein